MALGGLIDDARRSLNRQIQRTVNLPIARREQWDALRAQRPADRDEQERRLEALEERAHQLTVVARDATQRANEARGEAHAWQDRIEHTLRLAHPRHGAAADPGDVERGRQLTERAKRLREEAEQCGERAATARALASACRNWLEALTGVRG